MLGQIHSQRVGSRTDQHSGDQPRVNYSVAKGGQDHFGPYRLLKLVRSGHTCQVWEAVNSTDNRRVAIKALQRDQRYTGEEVTALKHEYDVGSELSNPNIIEVFEFAMDRGVPYCSSRARA